MQSICCSRAAMNPLVGFQVSVLLNTVAVLLFFTWITPCVASVPQSQLFPYLGPSEGTQYNFALKSFTSVPFMNVFQFLGKNYTTAYINGHGIITFGEGRGWTSDACDTNSTSIPTIAAYTAPNRMEDDPRNMKLMYKSRVTNHTTLKKAENELVIAFPSLAGKFSLREMLIVTWHNMPPWSNSNFRQLRNTFQAILATDYKYSFLLLYYSRIEWPISGVWAYTADAGIFGGTTSPGNMYLIPGSCTYSLVNITSMSNIDQPGKFIFRVDTDIELPHPDCLPISTSLKIEPLQFLPAVVPVMGSVPLLVRGFDLCSTHPVIEVNCTFHDISSREPVIVKGFVISGQLAVICPTPAEFYSLGRVRVDLTLQFHNNQVVKLYGFVYVVNTLYSMSTNISADLLKDDNSKTTWSLSVSWDPLYFNTILQQISRFFDTRLYRNLTKVPSTLKITIMELRGSKWQELYVVHNESNTGQCTFTPSPSVQTRLISDVVETLPTTIKFTGTVRMEDGDNILVEFVTSIAETTAAFGKLKNPAYHGKKCQFWYDNELVSPYDSLICPNTAKQVVADWRFSSLQALPATTVFMQTVPSPSGAASQCVYGDTGNLNNDQSTESLLFRHSPNNRRNYWSHFRKDVIQIEECCRWNNFTQLGCRKHFFPSRPLDNESIYEFPVPFRATCHTHLTTMDGVNYILNGLGIYWLTKCPFFLDIQVLLDRYIDITSSTHATVITGVVIKSYVKANDEESIKFQLVASDTRPTKLLMWMDEVSLNFYQDKAFDTYEYLQNNFTLYHDDVIVEITGTEEVLFSFSTGVSIKVSASADHGFLNIVGLMSKTMMGKNVTGLLGNFDEDPGNDLLSDDDNTTQSYNGFVEKWRVDQVESLFVTPHGKNYSSYYTLPPDFRHNRWASSDSFEQSSLQAHQDFERLVNAREIGSVRKNSTDTIEAVQNAVSNRKECNPPTNITNGGYSGESLQLNSTIQLFCGDNFYQKVKIAGQQYGENITFVCVEADLKANTDKMSEQNVLWISTDLSRPLSDYMVECLPKEKTEDGAGRQDGVTGEAGLSEMVLVISIIAGSLVIIVLAFLIYKVKIRQDMVATLSRLSAKEIHEFFEGRKQPHENTSTETELLELF